jgi:hypothetical protein
MFFALNMGIACCGRHFHYQGYKYATALQSAVIAGFVCKTRYVTWCFSGLRPTTSAGSKIVTKGREGNPGLEKSIAGMGTVAPMD